MVFLETEMSFQTAYLGTVCPRYTLDTDLKTSQTQCVITCVI